MVTIESMMPVIFGALALGVIAAAVSRQRVLIVRWCVWALVVPLVVGLFWLGVPAFAALACVAGVVAAVEFGGLMRLGWLDRVVLASVVVAVVLVTWLAPEQVWRILGLGCLLAAALPLLAGDAAHGLHRVRSTVLGIAWLSLLAAMVPLGPAALALFAAVSVSDVTAYVAGPKLGGPRLSPISPGKRLSGTVAGGLAGAGGLLDRIDSLLVALAVALLLS